MKANYAKGADISWLTEMEASGRKFYNRDGVAQDCLDVLKTQGVNAVRFRVWVNPKDGWNNKADVLLKARRAQRKNLRVMLDFHYSDTWADPGHQTKPAAWEALSLADLKTSVYDHTRDVLTALKGHGIVPEWVQTGNEINNGLLWPTGQITVGGPDNYAQLVNSGYDAVKAVSPSTRTVLHISNGFDNGLFRWNLDNLKQHGGKWDITGLSSYPPRDWAGHNQKVLANMQDLMTRYGKPIVIAEVGMPADDAIGCRDMLRDVMLKNDSLGANGIGTFYWEPQAYNWKNYNLVAFDRTGKPTVALDAFREK